MVLAISWSRLRQWSVALGPIMVALVSGCADSTPVTGPSTTGDTLTINCPASASGVSHFGRQAAVSWPTPLVSGGTPPVAVTCTPNSGSSFPAGPTTVRCVATDNRNVTAACSFPVTVVSIPQLSVTRLLAFGDSLTEGEDGMPSGAARTVLVSRPYPQALEALLAAHYTDQQPAVANLGKSGEAIQSGLRERLAAALTATSPDGLLLLHGANDLLNDPSEATTTYIAGKLGEMVRLARATRPNIIVMLATFPPQYRGSYPRDRGTGRDFVPSLNKKIASVASAEGALLVDLYSAFPSEQSTLISSDGLHPTQDGYALMAQVFFESIRSHYELGSGAGRLNASAAQ
jgi:lysophospholipase L1-like esterase